MTRPEYWVKRVGCVVVYSQHSEGKIGEREENMDGESMVER